MQYKQTVIFTMTCGKCRENHLSVIVVYFIYLFVFKGIYSLFFPLVLIVFSWG